MIDKNFLNDVAASSTIMITILTSLIISSTMIAWFLLQIYGISISGIAIPLSGTSFQSTQDFTSNETFNLSVISYSNDRVWKYQEGEGIVLYNNAIGKEYIYIDYISADENGNYINTYHLKNEVHSSYAVLIRNAHDVGSYGGDIFLVIENNQVKVVTPAWIGVNVVDTFAYDGVQNIDYPEIFTQFNDVSSTLTYQINGKGTTVSNIKSGVPYLNLGENIIYGGIGADINGFTLQTFNTKSGLIVQNGIIDATTAFAYTVLKIIFWTLPESIFPVELNIILIKTQLCGLAVSVFYFIRGGD